jgi:hypothetical protein
MPVKKQPPIIKRSPLKSNLKARDVRRAILAVRAAREARERQAAGRNG